MCLMQNVLFDDLQLYLKQFPCGLSSSALTARIRGSINDMRFISCYFTDEESCSIFGSPTSCSNGVISGTTELEEETEIRLLRKGVVR